MKLPLVWSPSFKELVASSIWKIISWGFSENFENLQIVVKDEWGFQKKRKSNPVYSFYFSQANSEEFDSSFIQNVLISHFDFVK